MTRRVIYVVDAPLSKRDRVRFGVNFLLEKGLDLEVWDIHEVFLPRVDKVSLDVQDLRYRQIRTAGELHTLSKDLTPLDSVICFSGMFVNQEEQFSDLRDSLLRSKARIGAVSASTRPPVLSSESLLKKIRRALRMCSWAHLKLSVLRLRSICPWTTSSRIEGGGDRQSLAWVWAGPSAADVDPSLMNASTKIRLLHTWDMDEHLRRPPHSGERVGIVFVESMGPLHPDFAVLDIQTFLTPEKWFTFVRQQIALIERQLGESVVVALHPRGTAEEMHRWYRPYPLSTERIQNLIANAELVVAAEPSTALGLCALYDTPLWLLDAPELYPDHKLQMESYSRTLGVPCERINGSVMRASGHLPPEDRVKFLREYVVAPGSQGRPFWEIVAEDIQMANSVMTSDVSEQKPQKPDR